MFHIKVIDEACFGWCIICRSSGKCVGLYYSLYICGHSIIWLVWKMCIINNLLQTIINHRQNIPLFQCIKQYRISPSTNYYLSLIIKQHLLRTFIQVDTNSNFRFITKFIIKLNISRWVFINIWSTTLWVPTTKRNHCKDMVSSRKKQQHKILRLLYMLVLPALKYHLKSIYVKIYVIVSWREHSRFIKFIHFLFDQIP